MPLYLVNEFTPKIAEKDEFIILCSRLPDLTEPSGYIVEIPRFNPSKATDKEISGVAEWLSEIQHSNKVNDFLWTKAQVKKTKADEDPKLTVTKIKSDSAEDITNALSDMIDTYYK